MTLKRALLLITVIILLILGGYISQSISTQGAGAIPGLQPQTDNPNASPMQVTPLKGAQFFLFTAIVLGSVVGMGAVLALIFWLLNREVVKVEKQPDAQLNSRGQVLRDILTLGRYSRRRIKAQE
jgi:hypothetical protein